ncbi:MAG TPA: universal stress protein [Gaiellaceae bacterium]|nr:universal stress protein [Gaiellaceae bacterium]
MSGCIVCGVDDTPGALAAAKVAAELAERLGAELVVAHVASLLVIPGASAVPNARRELRELEREEAARLVARIVDEAGCGDVEERVELGDPAERLVELADEYRATMLVVGSGGRGPLKEMILGSVSHRLCREAHCPVLVVPPAAAVSVIEPEAFAGARESR